MKTVTITKIGQYAASKEVFECSKRQALNYFRIEAARMRRESRLLKKLPDSVMPLPVEFHKSRLVTIASFALNYMDIEALLELINNHGVIKYSIN